MKKGVDEVPKGVGAKAEVKEVRSAEKVGVRGEKMVQIKLNNTKHK